MRIYKLSLYMSKKNVNEIYETVEHIKMQHLEF